MEARTDLEKDFFSKYPDSLIKNKLQLVNLAITDEDIPLILSVLATHPEVNVVNLTHNEITDVGLILFLSKAKLLFLNVSDNPIGDAGAKALLLNQNIKGFSLGDFHTTCSKMTVPTTILITPAAQPHERIDSAKKVGLDLNIIINNQFRLFSLRKGDKNNKLTENGFTKDGKKSLRKSH